MKPYTKTENERDKWLEKPNTTDKWRFAFGHIIQEYWVDLRYNEARNLETNEVFKLDEMLGYWHLSDVGKKP